MDYHAQDCVASLPRSIICLSNIKVHDFRLEKPLELQQSNLLASMVNDWHCIILKQATPHHEAHQFLS